MKRWYCVLAAGWVLAVLAGCGSNPAVAVSGVQTAAEQQDNIAGYGDEIRVEQSVITDWKGRNDGTKPRPDWLAAAQDGIFRPYMEYIGVDPETNVCRMTTGYGADLRAAQMRAQLEFARVVALDLAQKVSVTSADLARSGGMSQETAEAIQVQTKSQSKVEIVGGETRTEFWRKNVSEQAKGKNDTQYVVYQIHIFPQQDWDNLRVTYLRNVVKALPSELTPEAQEVAAMITRMDADDHHPIEMSQKQAEQKLEAERQVAQAQASVIPAEQQAAKETELRKIIEAARTDRTRISADRDVEVAKALSEGKVEQAAYISGDPILQAAAAVSADDAARLTARAIDMAARILN
ncbi:MAG: hypothetical protein LBM77_07645 [Spirochaetaceae bacterium]|jgi:hypothetical protein|nr:hypothetical protein [Spirochaetaceae bacterium]